MPEGEYGRTIRRPGVRVQVQDVCRNWPSSETEGRNIPTTTISDVRQFLFSRSRRHSRLIRSLTNIKTMRLIINQSKLDIKCNLAGPPQLAT